MTQFVLILAVYTSLGAYPGAKPIDGPHKLEIFDSRADCQRARSYLELLNGIEPRTRLYLTRCEPTEK